MLRLYKNKFQTFECAVEIDGADTSEAYSRIILYPHNDTRNVMYEGLVVEDKCIVDINSNVNVAKTGKVTLEVIVDRSLIFTPWEDVYEIVDQVKIHEASINYNSKSRVMPSVTVRDIPSSTKESTTVKLAQSKPMTKVATKSKLAPPKEEKNKLSHTTEKIAAEVIKTAKIKHKKETNKTASKLTRESSVAKLKNFKDISNLNIFEEFGN